MNNQFLKPPYERFVDLSGEDLVIRAGRVTFTFGPSVAFQSGPGFSAVPDDPNNTISFDREYISVHTGIDMDSSREAFMLAGMSIALRLPGIVRHVIDIDGITSRHN